MSYQSEELRKFLSLNNIKAINVAEKIGVTRGTMSSILNGKRSISKTIADSLSTAYGLSAEFLIYGRGSLLPEPAQSGESYALKAAKDTIDSLTAENLSWKEKYYRLLDRLAEYGLPCDSKPCSK